MILLSSVCLLVTLDSHKVAVDGFVDLCNTYRVCINLSISPSSIPARSCSGSQAVYINTSKTAELIIDLRSMSDSSPAWKHGNTIQQVTTVKYLSVHIDSVLTWHSHVSAVLQANSIIYKIAHIHFSGFQHDIQGWNIGFMLEVKI